MEAPTMLTENSLLDFFETLLLKLKLLSLHLWTLLSDWFTGMQPKDWATLLVGIAAFLVSVLSFRQRSTEGRFSLRRQLSDSIQKLMEIDAKLMEMQAPSKKADNTPDYLNTYNGMILDQRRFYVRQAAYISERIAALVSPYEYLLIGYHFGVVGEPESAEIYFRNAFRHDAKPVDRAVAFRQYARFLFSQNRLPDARNAYQESLKLFSGTSDQMSWHRAVTAERWAIDESTVPDWSKAIKLLELAKREYGAVSRPQRTQAQVQKIDELFAKAVRLRDDQSKQSQLTEPHSLLQLQTQTISPINASSNIDAVRISEILKGLLDQQLDAKAVSHEILRSRSGNFTKQVQSSFSRITTSDVLAFREPDFLFMLSSTLAISRMRRRSG